VATRSTDQRLDRLEEQVDTLFQLVERLIDHVLPQSFSEEYRAENAQALRDWPSKTGDTPIDEYTPRELGLLAGHTWASHAEAADVRAVADTGVLVKSASDALEASGIVDDERITPGEGAHDFHQGFVHGVRAFIDEDLNRISRLT
jgi:hypothetical protein